MGHPADFLIEQYGALKIIEVLAGCVTPERYQRMCTVSQSRLDDLIIAAEGVWDIHNALAIVRSAEALGVGKVLLVDCDYRRGKGRQTMRGSDTWMYVKEMDSIDEFITWIKNHGYKLAGACVRAQMTLEEIPVDQPLCLMMGNETRGLSERARDACDYLYRIPMFGMVESMNLSVAGSISLYELSKRKRQIIRVESPYHASRLAGFLIQSLGLERAKNILARLCA